MVEEEQANKKKIVGSIDRCGRQYHQLCRELGKQPRDFDSDAPLLEMEKCLESAIADLVKEKDERMKSVRVMFEDESKLCKRLGVEPLNLNRDRIPTNDQFNQLENHITFLKNELVKRQERFLSTRNTVREVMQQLEMSARSSFEIELFLKDPQTSTLTGTEMDKLKVILFNIHDTL